MGAAVTTGRHELTLFVIAYKRSGRRFRGNVLAHATSRPRRWRHRSGHHLITEWQSNTSDDRLLGLVEQLTSRLLW